MEESQTILIADSGSTKADWCLLHGGLPHYYRTSGISPYLLTETRIREILYAELVQHLPRGVHVSQIYFYGTGCACRSHQQLIHKLLAEHFLRHKLKYIPIWWVRQGLHVANRPVWWPFWVPDPGYVIMKKVKL